MKTYKKSLKNHFDKVFEQNFSKLFFNEFSEKILCRIP